MPDKRDKEPGFKPVHRKTRFYDAVIEDKKTGKDGTKFYKVRIKTSPYKGLEGISIFIPEPDFREITFRAKIDELTGEPKQYKEREWSYSPDLLIAYMENYLRIDNVRMNQIKRSKIEDTIIDDED